MSAPSDTHAPQHPAGPVIWTLVAEKSGDNAQIETVANAAGLPWIRRRFAMTEAWQTAKPVIAPDISHIDLAASDRLEAPWPDMIITSGRRLMNVALWIRALSPATKLVLVGRPHGRFEDWDLIVAAPQFRLPPRSNVINVGLPLLFPSRERIAHEALAWKEELDAMARPLTAVLIGAQVHPFRFSDADAAIMMERIAAMPGRQGSRFFVTSRRTTNDVCDAIFARLGKNDRLFRWEAGAPRNPYLALLGTADRFVVTGDSASMIVEVARLGKPLSIYELPLNLHPRHWPQHAGQAIGAALRAGFGDVRSDALLHRLGFSGGRDLTALHRALYRAGRAVPFGRPITTTASNALDAELTHIGARVRALLGARSES